MLLPDLVVPYYAIHKRNFNEYNSLTAMHLKFLYIFGFVLAFYQESCLRAFLFFHPRANYFLNCGEETHFGKR